MRVPRSAFSFGSTLLLLALLTPAASAADPTPIVPVGRDGKPINLDFEEGTLRGWTATGDAFVGQPIKGDTVAPRRDDMRSSHQGDYWLGGYEVAGDKGTGTLTSSPFKVTHRWGALRVAGGPWKETRVELALAGAKEAFFQVSGTESETLRPTVVDLEKQAGKEIVVRVVDEHAGHWGHVNFDGFAFYAEKPTFADEPAKSNAPAAGPGDAFKFAGLKPEEAAAAITLPPGFKATLFAGEPDIINPIAFTIDARGRLWVVQSMTYPNRAKEGEGKDTILIFEDTDNDGKFDKRLVFAEKLNLVSGIEVGFDGVWIGAAPYLLFIPADIYADEPKPTAEPKVLLDGWGYQDTHETLNSFTWGPDGWLYGCHGVFTESNVGKPGAPKEERVHINAGIWRYHPVRHVFERFAEGTSNPWGIDFDANGQLFAEACVIPHMWHIIQGARYQRQAGKHDNPYTFDDIKQSADHVHWAGAGGPHAGNGKSESAGGGHAHAGLMIYNGDNWPAEYRGKIFMNNIHGARINMDVPEAKGSGYVVKHGKDFALFNDRASQIINLKTGPDGGVYLIDWYDLNQCHNGDAKAHDHGTGRIFKITFGDAKLRPANLASMPDDDLAKIVCTSKNLPSARAAAQLLHERRNRREIELAAMPTLYLGQALIAEDESLTLRSNWAMSLVGLWKSDRLSTDISIDDLFPNVTAWTVRLSCEAQTPDAKSIKHLATAAKSSRSPVLRLALASAVQRLPIEHRWDILAGLLSHSEDADDHNLPLMYWYGLESVVGTDPARALALAAETKIPNILSFTVRRVAAGGDDASLASLVTTLSKVGDEAKQLEIVRGINAALKGRRVTKTPAGWEAVEAKLVASTSADLRSGARALGVNFESPTALAAMRATLGDAKGKTEDRLAALESLLGAKDASLPPTLQSFLTDAALRGPALRGLAAFDDAKTPAAILAQYATYAPAEKKDALLTLSARPSFAAALLDAVGTGKTVPAADLTADVLRQLRNLSNPDVDAKLAKAYGTVREAEADKLQRIAAVKKIIQASGPTPSAPRGRAIFAQSCGQCHVLFDAGGHVGPDITGSNRADLDYLLLHVIDPNAVIPNDYRASVLDTKDGRTLVGIVRKQDADAVTIQTANETIAVPRGEIEKLKESKLSMMPEGLLDALKDPELRDLVAYLRSPNQVVLAQAGTTGAGVGTPAKAGEPAGGKPVPIPATQPATKENAKAFFNGKDLTGWFGEPGVFSVENGEIVGKTATGLKRNEFLKSTLAVADFRLTFKMKLLPNTENSGVQFRSEVWQGHEMKGCQADAGAGWWGKLYEESGRGLLFPAKGKEVSADAFVKKEDWNTYEILAVGSKVRTAINGTLCTDLNDDKIARSGLIGLQVHSGGPTEARWKDIELEVDPKFEMKTVKE